MKFVKPQHSTYTIICSAVSQLFIGLSFLAFTSCSDFLSSIKNENSQEINTLLYNLDDLDVCMNGAYGAFCSSSYYGNVQLSDVLGSDCSATTQNNTISPIFESNSRDNYLLKYMSNIDNYQAGGFLQWGSFVTNNANIVIKSISENLPIISTHNDTLNANRLLGEAYLMRATVEYYNNYYVGRQYHPITLDSLSTLYRTRPILSIADVPEPRKTVAQLYHFLVSDLKKAKDLLPQNFDKSIHPAAYKFRCKKDVATAMLAKVYFQSGKFDSALVEINQLLANQVDISLKYPLAQGSSYLKMFQTTERTNYQPGSGSEVIMGFHGNSAFIPTNTTKWQLFQMTATRNLQNGDVSQCKFAIVLDKSLRRLFIDVDTIKDMRFRTLISISTNQGKESPAGQWSTLKGAYPTSNIPWLRASEFYLMRAEIYLHKDKLPHAIFELNLVRTRAGLAEITNTVSKQAIYKEIIDERARELCFENVRRWDNIRLASLSGSIYGEYLPEPYKSGLIPLGYRLNLIPDSVLPWNSNRLYSQIPENEYLFNPALVKENNY